MEPVFLLYLKLLTFARFSLRPDGDWHRAASPSVDLPLALRPPCVEQEYHDPDYQTFIAKYWFSAYPGMMVLSARITAEELVRYR